VSAEDNSVIGVIGEARLSDRLGVAGGLGVEGAESVSLSVDDDGLPMSMFRSTQAKSEEDGARDEKSSGGLDSIWGIDGAIVSSMLDGGRLADGGACDVVLGIIAVPARIAATVISSSLVAAAVTDELGVMLEMSVNTDGIRSVGAAEAVNMVTFGVGFAVLSTIEFEIRCCPVP
jgi:hypothetical protein